MLAMLLWPHGGLAQAQTAATTPAISATDTPDQNAPSEPVVTGWPPEPSPQPEPQPAPQPAAPAPHDADANGGWPAPLPDAPAAAVPGIEGDVPDAPPPAMHRPDPDPPSPAAPVTTPAAAALPAGSGALDSATVQRIVERLVALHFLASTADAQNPDTMAQAIRDFQSSTGISPSGTLDRDTIGRLTTP